MSLDKSDALVVRLADFSNSSRVVTLFTREFGKLAVLAKGAKRLKGPFEAALDLLSLCRVVFIRKASDGLDLLTEAQLVRRFRPAPAAIGPLYAGYYLAELLDGAVEVDDPHPLLFDAAVHTLDQFAAHSDFRLPLFRFELILLRENGLLPDFEQCHVCGAVVHAPEPADLSTAPSETVPEAAPLRGPRYWVSQGGLICQACGRPEYDHKALQFGTVHALRRLADPDTALPEPQSISRTQYRELRRVLTAAISRMLDKRPQMLTYLRFDE